MSFLKKFSKEIDQIKGLKEKFIDKKEGGESHHEASSDHARDHDPNSQSQYGAPPPGPQGGPQLPPGWIAQWDQNSQRWYYLEQATGRTQWEPPASYGQQPGYGGYPPSGPEGQHGGGAYYGEHDKGHEEKKDGGHKGGLAGAAGGLAVGGLVKRAMGHGSGNKHQDAHSGGGHGQEGYGQDEQYAQGQGPPPEGQPLPDETADGDSVSSSDKEDVEEAREDYQEAVKDGSQSDIEEAREEYQEEYEETYEE